MGLKQFFDCFPQPPRVDSSETSTHADTAATAAPVSQEASVTAAGYKRRTGKRQHSAHHSGQPHQRSEQHPTAVNKVERLTTPFARSPTKTSCVCRDRQRRRSHCKHHSTSIEAIVKTGLPGSPLPLQSRRNRRSQKTASRLQPKRLPLPASGQLDLHNLHQLARKLHPGGLKVNQFSSEPVGFRHFLNCTTPCKTL